MYYKKLSFLVSFNYPIGDECHIREGRYHEEILVKDLKGTKEKPFIIKGYQNERPILDGTVVLKNLTKWKKNGKIYR